MNLEQYQYILAINEYKNITKAAQVLYISQPSLSAFLQKLEARLGCRLFERIGKQLIPTHCGKLYIQYARQIVSLGEKCYSEIRNYSIHGTTKEQLRVGFTHSLSSQLFPRLMEKFHTEYPFVNVILKEAPGRQLEEMTYCGDLDIAMYSLPLRSRVLDYTVLRNMEFLIAVNKSSPLCQSARTCSYGYGRYLTQDELVKFPLISLTKGLALRNVLDRFFAQKGYQPNILIEIPNSLTAYQMAIHNIGPTLITEDLINPVYNDIMQYFHLKDFQVSLQLGFVYLNQNTLSSAASHFIEISRQYMSQLRVIP